MNAVGPKGSAGQTVNMTFTYSMYFIGKNLYLHMQASKVCSILLD